MTAWVPRTPPRLPTPTSRPPTSAHAATTARCSQDTDPVTHPTNVEVAIRAASVAISASGGRPPAVRQAMPTSIAPAPIVTPATGSPAAMPPPRTAVTGIAASRPPEGETIDRSKRAAARTAAVSAAGEPSGAAPVPEVTGERC